jgi:Lar family restriction alleviation protein
MSINVKLGGMLPCPFCGSTDIEAHCSGNNTGDVLEKPMWLDCSNCGASGPDNYSKFKDATEGWNNRIT